MKLDVIDADAHVIEQPSTWSFMDEDERKYEPMIVKFESGPELRGASGNVQQEFWVVDGRIQAKDSNLGLRNTSKESREMADIGARLEHMDELNIDVQVLYPTLFLRPLTTNVNAERALTKSYNRWLAEIWKRAPDRLHWAMLPPLFSPMSVVCEEVEWAKENGACGIFMRGLECDRRLTDPYFHDLYALAQRLDLMIGVHSGNGAFEVHDFYGDESGFNKFKLPCVGAAHDLLMTDTPAKFPDLRWGFIEVSAQWIPYMLNDLELRLKRRGRPFSKTILKDNNFFVACQVTDDLAHILDFIGPDNLVIGTDYGHHDTSTQIEALRMIRDDGKLPADVVDKILGDNAARLYGFTP
ncbi:MAG: amidohydrolase family protein [Alphaproteobacteria bacterium]|nr:amidohydrolase family protein [Alphaproteobacteria bacterium]MCZ6741978.1 amidohydrolase family protein [Alphaproteobacteria bacterium]